MATTGETAEMKLIGQGITRAIARGYARDAMIIAQDAGSATSSATGTLIVGAMDTVHGSGMISGRASGRATGKAIAMDIPVAAAEIAGIDSGNNA